MDRGREMDFADYLAVGADHGKPAFSLRLRSERSGGGLLSTKVTLLPVVQSTGAG